MFCSRNWFIWLSCTGISSRIEFFVDSKSSHYRLTTSDAINEVWLHPSPADGVHVFNVSAHEALKILGSVRPAKVIAE